MHDIDADSPAFYDHEYETVPQRSRQAPDWGGDDVFAQHPRRRFSRPDRPHMRVHPLGTVPVSHEVPIEPAPSPRRDPHADHFERAANGRRTVVVTGRPSDPVALLAAVTDRRRPSPTMADRIGGRPDRIAAWACGLGLTLILVAVTTADAAVI